MAERSFAKEVQMLKLGDGATFEGEGILAVTKALLQSGVSYIGGYEGAPVSHLIDVLSEFYSTYLIEQNTGTVSQKGPDCNSNKNISSIAFEGFYINENILGLVNTLNKRLYRNCGKIITNPISSMNNFFSNKIKTKIKKTKNIFNQI